MITASKDKMLSEDDQKKFFDSFKILPD